MSLKFFDDFGGYTLAQSSRVWNEISPTGLSISQTGGRFNDSYLAISSTSAQRAVSLTIVPSTTLVVGFAIKINTMPTSSSANANLIRFLDGATLQCELRLNADGTLALSRNGTALTNGDSVLSMAMGVWYYLECKVTIADSIGANTCQVNVNGVQWVNVATGQDTKNTASTTASQIKIGRQGSDGSAIDISHIYYDDGTTFLGDVRVETLTVAGDGATQDFTSSSGTHQNDVDDATADDESTYVESSDVNDIELFTFSNLTSTPVAIHGVATFNCVRKTDAGSRVCAPVLRSGGVNYDQASFPCVDSYKYDVQVITQDPNTSAAWTESGVNALEAGLKVVS